MEKIPMWKSLIAGATMLMIAGSQDIFAQHLDALLAKLPSLAANHYVPGLFEAFDDAARADELEDFAKKNLPPNVQSAVAKSADNIRFQAEFKARVLPQIDAWWQARVGR